MRKLADIKGEDALDVLADIIEPASEIASDKVFVNLVRTNQRMTAIQHVIKEHKKEILTIMAVIEGEDPATYAPSLVKLPVMLLEMLNDKDLIALFPSQQTKATSGPAMETTEVAERA